MQLSCTGIATADLISASVADLQRTFEFRGFAFLQRLPRLPDSTGAKRAA
jgi:hypothetical protein